jgi:PAS domain S-box-containing protein
MSSVFSGSGRPGAVERLSLLARAGELLSSSLDYQVTLAGLAELAVPELASWCVIDMVAADGTFERLTVAHSDPKKVAWARKLEERRPPDPEANYGIANVARTGQPELVREITTELLHESAGDDQELIDIVRELGLVSTIIVTLAARDRVLGVLTLVSDDPERLYDEEDLELAMQLGHRAGTAVDNARLFRELEQSQERYRLLFDRNPLPMWVYDTETLAFLAVNDAAVSHYGYSQEEFAAMTIKDIRPEEDVPALLAALGQGMGSMDTGGFRHRKKDGSIIDVEITAGRVVFDGRDAALVLANDVTDRKRLEREFAQTQKMDAIGRLAGGIAHDFNNVLLVIAGHVSLLRMDPETKDLHGLGEIERAADHASALTRQLLAFGRRQVLQSRPIDVNEIVQGLGPMLARIIGEDVEVAVKLAPDPAVVEADPAELERVIINLAVNARDAMPTGGLLTIETSNVLLDESFATTHLEGTAGPNVLLAVTDNGVGMSAEVRERLFEPFFTTKGGQGTGLGLASVFGVVRQTGGSIYVYSEEGHGSTFKIYLPATGTAPSTHEAVKAKAGATHGSETVLVVEDDERVRRVVQLMLERDGYRVVVASDPEEATACMESEEVDLVLTDVVMPGSSGRELVERLRARRGDLRVLFMSGYSDEAVQRKGAITLGSAFIEKPFSHDGLMEKVREALDLPAQ